MTSEQRHTENTTSGQFVQTIRHSCLRNKKIKTPPPHEKKLNFYGNRTIGTFGVADTLKAYSMATPKEPLHPRFTFLYM
ncbi:MAG: hypothetical protein LC109_00385 [Bacteroidia bacterium]|nr:hypothetical protein [Bacteroidia bacterium]